MEINNCNIGVIAQMSDFIVQWYVYTEYKLVMPNPNIYF